MKFALLGCDPDTLDLALAVASSQEHELVWAHGLGGHEPIVRAVAPGILQAEHWEGLLDRAVADAVIVSRERDQELRAEQLRKLAQVGATMIVAHPAVDSMLVYYELDMIRQESRALMLPYVPDRWHQAWRRLAEILGDGETGPLGALEQIVVEHGSTDRARGEVLRGFVRDMELVRPLCGAIDNVSAMTSAGVRSLAEEINYGTLSVQMSSLSSALVRWSISMAPDTPGTRFRLIGTHGKVTVDAPLRSAWRVQAACDGDATEKAFPNWDAAANALPRLVEEVSRDKSLESDRDTDDSFAAAPTWLDACRTMELADAVEHSLQRGRTIELHYDTPTEHATFKGVMSGVGCLLLIAGLVVLVVATTAVHVGVPLADYWPYLLLAVLVVFLLLQSLRLVFPSDRTPPRE